MLKERVSKKLAEDLSRERVLTQQVLEYITDHYGIGTEDLPRFFSETLNGLEEYELDLIFSPLFTPTLADRAGYAPILGNQNLSGSDVAELVEELSNQRTVYGHFLTPAGQNLPMALKEVTIERFVGRLYLERPIDPAVFAAVEASVPAADQPLTLVLVRKPGWQEGWRKALLKGFLSSTAKHHRFSQDKLIYLTDFLRTYRPGSFGDLNRQLASLIESCRTDLENVKGRSFHDAHLKEMYADAEAFDAAAQEEARQVTATYNQMIAHAEALQQDFETMLAETPGLGDQLSGAMAAS